MNDWQERTSRRIGGLVGYLLLETLSSFIRSAKMLAYEISADVGPFAKSVASFRMISRDVKTRFDANLRAIDQFRIRTEVEQVNEQLRLLEDLRDRFATDVVAALGVARPPSEDKARTKVHRIGEELFSILRTAELQLDRMEFIVEGVTDLAGGGGEPVRRVVLALDVSKYSELAAVIEGAVGASGIAMLNKSIADLVVSCIEQIGVPVDDTLVLTLGDGAILLFDEAGNAWEFAKQLHEQSEKANASMPSGGVPRWFRVGISSGDVVLEKITRGGKFGGLTMAGMAIIEAVRLEEAGETGQVLITSNAHAELDRAERNLFDSEEPVPGKHPGEIILAHRRQVVDPTRQPRATRATGKRKSVKAKKQRKGTKAKTGRKSTKAKKQRKGAKAKKQGKGAKVKKRRKGPTK